MKDKSFNPAKITVCGYGNSTRVSVTKLSFPTRQSQAIFYGKLKSVLDLSQYGPGKEGIPTTLWDNISQAVKHYNNKMQEPFIQVFYDHRYIGTIHRDLKRYFWICDKCKKDYDVIPAVPIQVPTLTRFQRVLKLLFPGAFELPVLTLPDRVCQCGNKSFYQDYI